MDKKLLFLLLFIVACAPVIEQEPYSESDSRTTIDYSDGKLSYSHVVTKPTPCYLVEVEELIMESFPVQVRINLNVVENPETQVCIQVLTDETVTGEIPIDHRPGIVEISVNGERAFSSTLS